MSARHDRRTRRTALVSATALLSWAALGIAPSVAAGASGSPSPAPSSSPETNVEAMNPDWDPPETVDTYVGQSVQSRRTADGVQNAGINFRWAVTQVNAESLNNLDVSIPVPMDDTPGLRSLTGKSNMPETTDGGVLFDFDDVDGIQTKRVLNLWPQDRQLPVDIRTEFTLNGEPVQAQQIVGKGGLVTAKYTIVNNSVKDGDVSFTNVKGEKDTEKVETSQAFVGISKQFIPQSWAQFDPGHGIFGADGRGNFQTQWITLAFLPFAEGGEASFGWSAVIPDGEGFIPKMVIEVSPLYVPPHAEGEEEEESAESENGVPKPNLDDASASVHSGVEDLVAGISSLADTIGAATGATKEGVQIAISQIKAAVNDLCVPELLDCSAPAGPPLTEVLEQLTGDLKDLSATLEEELANASADNEALDLTKIISTLTGVNTTLKNQLTKKQDKLDTTCPDGAPADPPGPAGPPTQEDCDELAQDVSDLAKTTATLDTVIADLTEVNGSTPQGLDEVAIKAILGILNGDGTAENPGVISSLEDVSKFLADLSVPLGDLQAGIDQIGAAIDAGGAILGDVGSSLDQISSGKAQISGGLGMASTEVSAYIADVVAVAQAAAASGKEAAAEIEAHANTIKAQLAGLKSRMAESPLPYGGGMNTVYAPAGNAEQVSTDATAIVSETGTVEKAGVQPTTELFGAYQFMLDPADTNKPYTPWRIVLAFVLVIGAGLIGMMISRRNATVT